MDGQDAVMGWWRFGWQGRFETCPYVRRVGSLDRNGCVGGLVGVPRSAPGPHPNPLPSNGRGGMFVADECVVAVMGAWLFGWCAPRRPGHTPLW